MQDFTLFFEECERAPRLNDLQTFFSETAAGRSGMPLRRPQVDDRLLPREPLFDRFMALHRERQGAFDQHYLSSIPYRLEEECRLGCGMLAYSARRGRRALKIYSLGTAEGTMARVISELGEGRIETLSCSPNVENLTSFLAYGEPPYATFFHGPFHHLSPESIAKTTDLKPFSDGFDIIMEDTTFQMYSPNRTDQIRFVIQHLKSDGIMLFVEKFKQTQDSEFWRRELQKDHGFKARYFTPDDIAKKKDVVLSRMNENEVTLKDMADVLKRYFRECFVTWNSGNFYTVVAGNNAANMQTFLDCLSPPALPREYLYEPVPYRLYRAQSRSSRPASELA
jgi:hypothetical protein